MKFSMSKVYLISAFFIKLIKSKIRSPLITILCIIFPSLLFSIISWFPMKFNNQYSKLGFHDYRYLPSSGLGQFTFSLFCKSFTTVEYTELSNITYEESAYKILFESYEKLILNEEIRLSLLSALENYLHLKISDTAYIYNIYKNSSKSSMDEFISKIEHERNISSNNFIFKMKELLHNKIFTNELSKILNTIFNVKQICDKYINTSDTNYLDLFNKSISNHTITNFTYIHKYETIVNKSIYAYNLINKLQNITTRKILFSPNNTYVNSIKSKIDNYFKLVTLTLDTIFKYKNEIAQSLFIELNDIKTINNNKIGLIMKYINDKLEIITKMSVYTEIVNDKNDIINRIVSPLDDKIGCYFGINFDNLPNIYSIIYHPNLASSFHSYWQSNIINPFLSFYDSFISVIQDLVDISIIKISLNSDKLLYIDKKIKKAASYCYDSVYIMKILLLPAFLIISLMPSLFFIIQYIVHERKMNLFEFFNTIGIDELAYIEYTLFIDIILTVITFLPVIFILRISNIFKYTNMGFTFLILLGVIFSSYCLIYLICNIAQNSSISILITLIVLCLGISPFVILRLNSYNSINKITQFICNLVFITAFSNCINCVLFIETFRKTGPNLSDFYTSYTNKNEFGVFTYLFMLYFDGLVYLLIWFFISKFSLKKIFKYIKSIEIRSHLNCFKTNISTFDQISFSDLIQNEFYDCTDEDISLDIRDICVKYDSNKNVIEDLSITFYQNNIYVLIGQNGCGKSTLIKTMMGIIHPFNGEILYGSNLDNNSNIGYCPQHDIIIDYLTVEEHLYFYWRVINKSNPYKHIHQINSIIDKMGLKRVKNIMAYKLSGGQKRKLSIGISFIGSPSIVILDEPTSNVDPESRRSVYDLIESNRNNKTIIISTHHMEETEILGDIIIVMSKGKLIEKGRVIDLKRKYGLNTKFTIAPKFQFKFDEIIKFVYKYIHFISSHSIKNGEINFYLTNTYKITPLFTYFLTKLLNNINLFYIKHYTINDCSMEEIFINIINSSPSNQGDDLSQSSKVQDLPKSNQVEESSSSLCDTNKLTEDFVLLSLLINTTRNNISILNHLWMIIKRRIISNLRNPRFYICKFFIPLILLIFSCLIQHILINTIEHKLSINFKDVIKSNNIRFTFSTTYTDDYKNYNPLLLEFLEQNNSIINHPHWDYMTNVTNESYGIFDLYCYEPQTMICPTKEVKQNNSLVDNRNRILFSNEKYKGVEFEWIGNCKLDDHLKASDHFVPYKRYFSLDFINVINTTGIIISNEQRLAVPISINLVNNLIYSYNSLLYNKTFNEEIITKNEPIDDDSILKKITRNLFISNFVILTSISLCLITANFIFDPHSERISGLMTTQLNLNIHPLIYWFAFYLVDIFIYIVSISLILLIFLIFGINIYIHYNLKKTIIRLLLYGLATIPLQYVLSINVKNVGVAYLFYLIISGFSIILALVFETEKYNSHFIQNIIFKKFVYNILLSIMPPYLIARYLFNTYSDLDYFYKYQTVKIVENFLTDNIILSLVGLIFYIIHIIMILKPNYFTKLLTFKSRRKLSRSFSEYDDLNSDVIKEKEFVLYDADLTNSNLILCGIKKSFKTGLFKRRRVIKDINFSVLSSECFGLLGVNGAGKTTLFKIINGTEFLDSGRIQKSCKDNRIQIAYCPQEDNLDLMLTPEEHIHYLLSLAGYSESLFNDITNYILKIFDMEIYRNIPIKFMSFGNRRRLSTAITIIGNPLTILLDEATAGMDPSMRNITWSFIRQLCKFRSVLFTTHIMSECEQYSDRIAIMVRGRIKCIGSITHIKEKYGSGYDLIVKFKEGCTKKFIKDINLICRDTKVSKLSKHGLFFHLPIQYNEIHKILNILCNNLKSNIISHYTLRQTDLESVFRKLSQPTYFNESDSEIV